MTKQAPDKNDQPTKRRTQQKSDQVLLKVKLLTPDAKMPRYAILCTALAMVASVAA